MEALVRLRNDSLEDIPHSIVQIRFHGSGPDLARIAGGEPAPVGHNEAMPEVYGVVQNVVSVRGGVGHGIITGSGNDFHVFEHLQGAAHEVRLVAQASALCDSIDESITAGDC